MSELKNNQRLRVKIIADYLYFDLIMVDSKYRILGGVQKSIHIPKIPTNTACQAEEISLLIQSLQRAYNDKIEIEYYTLNEVNDKLQECYRCRSKVATRFYLSIRAYDDKGWVIVNSRDLYRVEFTCFCNKLESFTGTINEMLRFNYVTNCAYKWLEATGRESLTELMLGFDFVLDCYNNCDAEIKKDLNETQFMDLLQKRIGELF